MNNYAYELQIAEKLVRIASTITEWFRKEGFLSFEKEDKSPVTIADFASQVYIVSTLRKLFPHDHIVAEESSNKDLSMEVKKIIDECFIALKLKKAEQIDSLLNYRGPISDREWSIDPIDGTKGYQEGLSYAVGIGLMEKSRPAIGSITVPNYESRGNLTFITQKGYGSYVSQDNKGFKRIQVNDKTNFKDLTLCHSLHYDEPWVMEFAKNVGIGGFIQMDSMAKFGLIAEGKAELYLKPMRIERSFTWDFMPGILLVQEAGGIVSDLTGKKVGFFHEKCIVGSPGLVATNHVIHETIIKLLKDKNYAPT